MKRAANGEGKKFLEANVSHEGDDCLIWPFSCCTPGYGQFSTSKTQRMMAHRYMCELARGPTPSPRHEAAHSCGNRRCVNPHHLSWKTRKDNQLDRREHGTVNHWGYIGKLSRLQVIQIRQLKGCETSIETAAKYGITESNVRLIQSGKTWATFDKRPKQTQAVKVLVGARKPMHVEDVAKATGSHVKATYLLLSKLARRSQIVRVRRGVYSANSDKP